MTTRPFRAGNVGPLGAPQKYARGARLPVILVTGFLGAGKTTLISRFLKAPEGYRTAVIVNEFGEIGIDDVLLRSSADETVLLGNGCVCCAHRSDLQMALQRLVADRERGAIPPFARVLIETSGLADPTPILQTFVTDRAVGREFAIEMTMTVVDSVIGEETLGWSAEARKQVILADRVAISKSDLVDGVRLSSLVARLNALNPRADVVTAAHGELDPGSFVRSASILPVSVDTGIAEAVVHSDGIGSFVLTEHKPLAWREFARTMELLVALRGNDLLRAKGLLNIEKCDGPVVVQYVQHLAGPPVELKAWPGADQSSRLVFITRNISEMSVHELFEAVRALRQGPQA